MYIVDPCSFCQLLRIEKMYHAIFGYKPWLRIEEWYDKLFVLVDFNRKHQVLTKPITLEEMRDLITETEARLTQMTKALATT